MAENEILDTNLLIRGELGDSTIFSAIEYPKVIDADVKLLVPARKDYLLAIEIAADLYRAGTPLPALDIIIAAMCINRHRVLRTRDSHYKAIADVRPELELRLEG